MGRVVQWTPELVVEPLQSVGQIVGHGVTVVGLRYLDNPSFAVRLR